MGLRDTFRMLAFRQPSYSEIGIRIALKGVTDIIFFAVNLFKTCREKVFL